MIETKSTGWRPEKCRPGCAYAGAEHAGFNECLYQAITDRSRGCDPGKECTCYRRLRPGERKPRSIDEMEGLKPQGIVKTRRRKRKCGWDNRKGHRRQEHWNRGEA